MDVRLVAGYATTADGLSLAYHVTGGGPRDIVWLPAGAYPIDLLWDEPGFVHVARRLGSFSRTIWTGYRGLGGSSGRTLDIFRPGVVVDDLMACLEAAGCADVVLVAPGLSGPWAVRLAAAHPERVQAIVLVDTYAHYVTEAGYPIGYTEQMLEQMVALASETWAVGAMLDSLAPSKAEDARFRDRWARVLRLGSPQDEVAESLRLAYSLDVRQLLPDLKMPTLVLHRTGDRSIRVEAGRYLAEKIPGAKYVELAGADHLFFLGDVDALMDEIEEFLTGAHQAPEGDMVMAAVLFTDIVSSTEQAARMGHRGWSRLTAEHDTMVRSTLARYRGHEIKTIGDGFLATFDATTRAVRAATDIVTGAQAIGLQVRAGVHAGEIEIRPDDVAGLTVNIAKRICDLAGPCQVLVSEAARGLILDSEIALSDHGIHILKGVPNERRLFAVDRSDSAGTDG